ncbi:MAG: hypothetical protein EHM20_11755 [Alphaproteobacteria bacterium]|nr:MAG: hypothetical protein EHM20_11755 [Alphaproteobacteria bacterium]
MKYLIIIAIVSVIILCWEFGKVAKLSWSSSDEFPGKGLMISCAYKGIWVTGTPIKVIVNKECGGI